MFLIDYAGSFKKDYKRIQKRGHNMQLLNDALALLSETGTLPEQYRPHKLVGKYKGYWEAHIEPDWLIIWERKEAELVLIMMYTGTHSDLF